MKGWRAKCTPENHVVNEYQFDMIIGADGKTNTLRGISVGLEYFRLLFEVKFGAENLLLIAINLDFLFRF